MHLQVCEVAGGWEATLDYAVLDSNVPVVELRVCDCAEGVYAEAAIAAVEGRLRSMVEALGLGERAEF
jgi:hypothetical protein